jgi:hypothetical protein
MTTVFGEVSHECLAFRLCLKCNKKICEKCSIPYRVICEECYTKCSCGEVAFKRCYLCASDICFNCICDVTINDNNCFVCIKCKEKASCECILSRELYRCNTCKKITCSTCRPSIKLIEDNRGFIRTKRICNCVECFFCYDTPKYVFGTLYMCDLHVFRPKVRRCLTCGLYVVGLVCDNRCLACHSCKKCFNIIGMIHFIKNNDILKRNLMILLLVLHRRGIPKYLRIKILSEIIS